MFELVHVQRLFQHGDISPGFFHHGPVLILQHVGRDHGHQQAENDDDHHDFQQREALLTAAV